MENCSRLTAAEGGARLAAAAGTKNVMITEHTNFIPTSLLIEYAHGIRGTLSSGYKRSVYIARSSRISCVAHELKILTDLHVIGVTDYNEVQDWKQELEDRQVLVCTSTVFSQILKDNLLKMTHVNVLIVDSCHLIFKDIHLQHIMQLYKDCDNTERPRILAMTYPLFLSTKDNMDNNDQVDDSEEDTSNLNYNEDKTRTDVPSISENDVTIDANKNVESDENVDGKIDNSSKIDQVDDEINIDRNLDEIYKENIESNECVVGEANENLSKDERTKENTCDVIEDLKVIENDEKELKPDQSSVMDYDCSKQVYKNCDDFEMYEKLEWRIEEMEMQLCCEMDLAEDIDGGKRLSPSITKPKEVIVEFGNVCEISDPYKDLESFMRDTIKDALQFINEHRYDPTEIYGEELYEEFMNIPDPTVEPKETFCQFLYVLDELGPYAADKAAFSLLTKLEKLKIKVPYERHFLLLCLCTSVFVKIRSYADTMFSKYESDWEKLALFSTQKVLRFAAILEQYRPDDIKDRSMELKNNRMICGRDLNNKTDNEVEKVSHPEEIQSSESCDKVTSQHTDNKLNESLVTSDNIMDNKCLKRSRTIELLDEINKCDFTSLGDKIEDTVNVIQCDLKDFDANYKNEALETKININSASFVDSVNENIDKSDKSDKEITAEVIFNDITQVKRDSKSTDIVIISGRPTDNLSDTENTSIDKSEKISESKIDSTDFEISNTCENKTNSEVPEVDNNNSDKPADTKVESTDNLDVSNTCKEECNSDISKVDRNISDKPTDIKVDSTDNLDVSNTCQEESNSDVLKVDNNNSDKPADTKIYSTDSLEANLESNSDISKVDKNNCDKPAETKVDSTRSLEVSNTSEKKNNNNDPKVDRNNSNKPVDTKVDSTDNLEVSNICEEKNNSNDSKVDRNNSNKPVDTKVDSTDNLEVSNTCEEKSNSDVLKVDNNNSDKPVETKIDSTSSLEVSNSDQGKQLKINSEVAENPVKSDVKINENDEQKIYKRGRGRGRRKQNVKSQPQTSDSLCGIVFMNEPLMAKIMFMIIVDMSRSRPSLSHLCAQYCAVETVQEPREHQRQGRKQEDVLKKFRMHECNLLLATSALEEGIDLPRCNLVVRWDVPPSYRSYGLCRSRARAAKSSVTLLANAERHSSLLVHNLAVYKELDQIVTRKCGCGIQNEPPQKEEIVADTYTPCIKAYKPNNRQIINKINNINTNLNNMNAIDMEKGKEIELGDSRTKDKEDGSPEFKRNDKNCTECIENQTNKDDMKKEIVLNLSEKSEIENTEKSNVKEKSMDISENNILDFREVCTRTIQETNVGDKVNSEVKISYSVEKGEEASVDLNSAIALINRYCGKLPSDTFTRLAPQWWMEEVRLPAGNEMKTAYICTLRMPLNCPVKYNIVGHPMPTRVLARRMVALQACRILHKSGELDDQLMPIGKENFKAAEMESNLNQELDNNDSARPGTTKRRQYYFKRTAWAFTDCQPIIDTSDADIEANPIPRNRTILPSGTKRNMLYAIVSNLWCALPERYNTRGRKLHLPQYANQAIGILVARYEPTKLQIPAFPVYTRSGEVRVSVEPALDADVRLSPRRDRLIRRFMRFVFSDVLRVRRRGMKLQTEGSTQNNYYIVPTVKRTTETGTSIDIDWSFLELIYQHTEEKKIQEQESSAIWEKKEKGHIENPLLKTGEVFAFESDKYSEAVVTPWYRNQDQPQFFLVAEICWHLTPDSAFPSEQHATFRSYYKAKYGADLTQNDQPLLDVDHTSARLNLLTPRYVNRKGVALPVSSERTRRAKRDRLDQKQIMVPELCKVHPFAAPLWFATVALPCVLYRINALLIADEIRRAVALDVGLGIPRIDDDSCPGFTWPALDFGWSLAEVLSADSEKHDKKKEIEDCDQSDDLEKEQRDKEEQENLEKSEGGQEQKEKTINDILQEKEEAESGFEIGTWSNEMASSIPQSEYDEFMEPLPPNLTFCTSATGGANWSDPIDKPKHYSARKFSMADSDCSYLSSDFDTDDSDFNSDGSDEDSDGFSSSKNSNAAMGVRIEYKTAHEAEAVDVERRRPIAPAPMPDRDDDMRDVAAYREILKDGTPPEEHVTKFRNSVIVHEKEIIVGHLITKSDPIKDLLPEGKDTEANRSKNINVKVIISANSVFEQEPTDSSKNGPKSENVEPKTSSANKDSNVIKKDVEEVSKDKIKDMIPYLNIDTDNGQITLETIEKNKRTLLSELKKTLTDEEIKKLNCFSMVDIDIDAIDYVNEKVANVGFDSKDKYEELVNKWDSSDLKPYYLDNKGQSGKDFDFDYQPSLEGHPGPSPSVILQALTMSNANDGINLERLETIGDSFLKFAITAYLYCAHPAVHEGKLSHMRSKQVSNLNLYRLGRNKRLGARMIASKFEPHDNWLPPCHRPPHTMQPGHDQEEGEKKVPTNNEGCFIPYNLITQHSIPDKSIADCVEALIGAYLLECGPRGALLFMSWLGIRVLPCHLLELPLEHPYVQRQSYQATSNVEEKPPQKTFEPLSSDSESCCSSDEEGAPDSQPPPEDWSWPGRPVGSLRPYRDDGGKWVQPVFGELKAPPSPLLRYIEDPEGELEQMLSGYEELEKTLQYRFRDRSLLLQALTHASHQKNRLTDCYQRLEFLGDAILDYLITRHLYEDPRRHSPGALTDLRSALVNNTIFATLAARHGFHKYFRHMSPGLNEVLTKYVKIQEENGHSISEEHYLIQEDEMEQAEDVEVPKALGDLFESVAGAIFLDSGMSLGAVWRSYARLMMAELEAFSAAAPKSPVRELLEAEPDTAKFGKPERLADGRRVRVCVEVFGRGTFKGIGRNYRIAKGTAARCALRHLKIHRGR